MCTWRRACCPWRLLRPTTEEEPGKYYFKERFSGKVHRSFRLPVNANSEAAAVSYTDGVLAVTIPKLENVGAKKLTIA